MIKLQYSAEQPIMINGVNYKHGDEVEIDHEIAYNWMSNNVAFQTVTMGKWKVLSSDIDFDFRNTVYAWSMISYLGINYQVEITS